MRSNYLLLSVLFTWIVGSTAIAQSWSRVGAPAFSNSSVGHTCMAIGKNDTPYIAYQDFGHNDAVSVMKYNGTSWVYVGTPGFSNTVNSYMGNENVLTLRIDTTGKPYVFYQDSTVPPFSVMTYNGSNWVFVDSPGIGVIIDDPQPAALSMDLDPAGNPYISWINGNHGSQVSVLKHTAGSGWAYVGAEHFSPGGSDYTYVAIDHSGTPWVAFADGNVSGHLSVQKFNGSNWLLQGTEGFTSTYMVDPISMAFDNNNNPYVAFEDGRNAYNAFVMMYNGANWANVGDTDFSVGAAYYMNIRISPGGIPVVSYSDKNTNFEATAEYFDGVFWDNLGQPDFSQGEADWVSLAINSHGVPFIGFIDDANSNTTAMYTYGIATGIKDISSLAALNVYPNPSNGKFQVRLQTTQQEDVQLSLYDMMGQIVWEDNQTDVNGQYSVSIDASAMARGVYALRVKTASGVESRMVEIK